MKFLLYTLFEVNVWHGLKYLSKNVSFLVFKIVVLNYPIFVLLFLFWSSQTFVSLEYSNVDFSISLLHVKGSKSAGQERVGC